MLYILDYGAGNVASLGSSRLPVRAECRADSHVVATANSVKSLGFEFKWVESVEDIEQADVSLSSITPRYVDRQVDVGATPFDADSVFLLIRDV